MALNGVFVFLLALGLGVESSPVTLSDWRLGVVLVTAVASGILAATAQRYERRTGRCSASVEM
ncbi:MAG: hypothetical protein ACR2GK_07760 [Gemmatimonadaceae bacterium]